MIAAECGYGAAMGAIQQVQRWKLRRRHPGIASIAKIVAFVMGGLCAVCLVAALAGIGSRGADFASAGLLALLTGMQTWLWWYISRGPTGDYPPMPTDPTGVLRRAVRRQWVYCAVLLAVGIVGIALAVTVATVNLAWGIPALLLGILWALVLSTAVRRAMARLEQRTQ